MGQSEELLGTCWEHSENFVGTHWEQQKSNTRTLPQKGKESGPPRAMGNEKCCKGEVLKSTYLITLAYQAKIGALKSTLLIFKLVNQS
jgi:hypothetical protein